MRPIHTGAILEEDFLKHLKAVGLTASSRAQGICISPSGILQFIKGQYSEIFIKFHKFSRSVRLKLAKFDYWRYTTDGDDTTVELNYQKKNKITDMVQLLKGLSLLSKEEYAMYLKGDKL